MILMLEILDDQETTEKVYTVSIHFPNKEKLEQYLQTKGWDFLRTSRSPF